MRWFMVVLTSSMDGLWLGSLSQHRVIRVSMGSGRSLIRGGRVPSSQETSSQSGAVECLNVNYSKKN